MAELRKLDVKLSEGSLEAAVKEAQESSESLSIAPTLAEVLGEDHPEVLDHESIIRAWLCDNEALGPKPHQQSTYDYLHTQIDSLVEALVAV